MFFLQLLLLHFAFDLYVRHFKVCLWEVHAVGRPGYVVGEVGGVDGGEALGVHQEEVGLLLGAIKTDGQKDTIVLSFTP